MNATTWTSGRHRSRFLLIALVAALAISVSGALRYYLRSADALASGSLGRLAKIVGPHRLTRARLTGGFAYAQCQGDTTAERLVRGLLCDRSAPTSWSSANRLRAFAADMRLGGRAGSSSDVHTTGIWDLIWGRADDAVADLREAGREPTNARPERFGGRPQRLRASSRRSVGADRCLRRGRQRRSHRLHARRGAVHARGVARAVVSPDRRDCRVEPISPDGWLVRLGGRSAGAFGGAQAAR